MRQNRTRLVTGNFGIGFQAVERPVRDRFGSEAEGHVQGNRLKVIAG
jgi:hypothetical protein